MTTIPKTGDPFVITRRPGYKLIQNRPFDCRYSCRCGACNGVLTEHHGIVERVVYYADNSIEAEVRMADGTIMIDMVKSPSGDIC
jgi:hypothetical protein